jgi:hypothetical protein
VSTVSSCALPFTRSVTFEVTGALAGTHALVPGDTPMVYDLQLWLFVRAVNRGDLQRVRAQLAERLSGGGHAADSCVPPAGPPVATTPVAAAVGWAPALTPSVRLLPWPDAAAPDGRGVDRRCQYTMSSDVIVG